MNNKLLRLTQIIQENFPEKLVAAFKSTGKSSLDKRIAMINRAIGAHLTRAERLYLQAGKQRTAEERRASAQAELAAFVFAYLTGDPGEYVDSAVEAMQTLGRQGESDLVTSLARS